MTRDQSLVCSALNAIGLESLPPEDNRVGGPVRFKITDDFIAQLKEGNVFVVDGAGQVELEQKQRA